MSHWATLPNPHANMLSSILSVAPAIMPGRMVPGCALTMRHAGCDAVYIRLGCCACALPSYCSCATRGGITDEIGGALVGMAGQVRSFLNYANGSVIALSQTCFAQPYAFLPRALLWQVRGCASLHLLHPSCRPVVAPQRSAAQG